MGIEIERKFLVKDQAWRELVEPGIIYAQGYLTQGPERTVRVRVANHRGFLTIKTKTEGMQRREYEYEIPVDQAWELLEYACYRPLIEKVRYRLPQANVVWEIDEFRGENEGLIVAEVELEHPDQEFDYPPWLGPEVSHDPRYYNSNLVQYPYTQWP